jgi:(2Fe-2S) ferredoxin
MAKKKVKLKISRDETWYPEIEVTDEEIVEMVVNGDHEDTDRIYDDYQNKRTYDADTFTEIEGEN